VVDDGKLRYEAKGVAFLAAVLRHRVRRHFINSTLNSTYTVYSLLNPTLKPCSIYNYTDLIRNLADQPGSVQAELSQPCLDLTSPTTTAMRPYMLKVYHYLKLQVLVQQ